MVDERTPNKNKVDKDCKGSLQHRKVDFLLETLYA